MSACKESRHEASLCKFTMSSKYTHSFSLSFFLFSQAAKEHEELQREGDDIDAMIRKVEKEIQHYKSFKLLSIQNNKFSKSLQAYDLSGTCTHYMYSCVHVHVQYKRNVYI